LGTCPPARPLVALGAFTPSPGLRSENLTWGLAMPVPLVEELVRRCRAPRAAGSLLPVRPLVAASADREPTWSLTADMPLIWSLGKPVFLAEGGPGAEKRGAIVTFSLTFGRFIFGINSLSIFYLQASGRPGRPPPNLRRHRPAPSPERDWTEMHRTPLWSCRPLQSELGLYLAPVSAGARRPAAGCA
jgi:hypothetical protein